MKSRDQHVELRRLTIKDRDRLAELANNRKIWLMLGDRMPNPYTRNDAMEFIELISFENPYRTFGISYKGDLCGACGLIPGEDIYKYSAEIGFWVGEDYWGRGIGSTAIGLLCEYGEQEFGLNRVYANVFDGNKGSIRALENNEFTKEGYFKSAVYKDGKFLDEIRFGKLLS